MISARFFYAEGHCTGCTVEGHSGYAEEGADIVCAYASSAVQTVANLMTEIYALPVSVTENEKNANVTIRLKKSDASGNAERLLAGLELQLSELSKIFPAHIQLKHMEV